MKNYSIKGFFLSLFIFLSLASNAEIKLPAIVSSDMVLQRNTTVVLWGWADGKEKITIKASWIDAEIEVKADKEGNWKIEVETTNSKEAQTIQLKSKSSEVLLENILFGEVWLCSGQSNMYQPIRGYNSQPTFGCMQTLVNANNSNLRLFTVEKTASKSPSVDVDKYRAWQAANSENVADFSAVAYYYGMQLQKVLDVPVGMIHTSWGGSTVQAWMSKEAIAPIQAVDLSAVDLSKGTNHIPTALFNAMINPLIPYTIKGALWYQGESNRQEPLKYEQLLPAMVNDWKMRWGLDELPFYYVQIAPFSYGKTDAFGSFEDNTAFIRESMERCLDSIPNSGMAVTMDIGDEGCIHPPKKKEVADRLLYNVLSQTYGLASFDGKSPRYEKMIVKKSKVEVWFTNAEQGLFAYDKLKDFEIAGADRVFFPAEAKITNRNKPFVTVSSDKVPEPVAVRYAWRNFVEGSLFDSHELPASSFRTDNWDDATLWRGEE